MSNSTGAGATTGSGLSGAATRTAPRSVTHADFTIERAYPKPPARVFAAFADPELKARWFTGPDGWVQTDYAFDFRPGGREINAGAWPDGRTSRFDCLYHDIVPNERIIYSYTMDVSGARISASLATIEITPTPDGGARLKITEQGAFLDGYDGAEGRKEGTTWLLDKVGAVL